MYSIILAQCGRRKTTRMNAMCPLVRWKRRGTARIVIRKCWKHKVLKSKLLSVCALLLLNPAKLTDKCSVLACVVIGLCFDHHHHNNARKDHHELRCDIIAMMMVWILYTRN